MKQFTIDVANVLRRTAGDLSDHLKSLDNAQQQFLDLVKRDEERRNSDIDYSPNNYKQILMVAMPRNSAINLKSEFLPMDFSIFLQCYFSRILKRISDIDRDILRLNDDNAHSINKTWDLKQIDNSMGCATTNAKVQ